MPRTFVFLFALFLPTFAAAAQEPAQSQPPARQFAPTVTFLCDWKAQDPPRYSIAIDSTGRITYRSDPSADPNGGSAPEPYFVEWTANPDTRDKILELAKRANYFQGNFESKARVADTGTKTLRYHDQARDSSASYNFSENPAIRDLTDLFQAIESTAEMGRKLQRDARYNKLAIDEDLKVLKQQQHEKEAIEFGSVLPILQQIASDTSMLRMAQQHAREILRAARLPLTQAD